jgi:NitT/TauT family transport system substrate-binding protein
MSVLDSPAEQDMRRLQILPWLAAVAIAACVSASALAQDMLKLAVGAPGNWDTCIPEVGQRAGIFKKHGLTLELLYTQGGGETQQAVISGSVEIGVAAGIMGVLSAYSKGAPVRIIGAETTGAQDLFWYVKADSPIKSLKDTEGKTIAYSTNGSSTHGIVMAYMKQYELKAKPLATGGPPGTLTQVMSGQIDVGWAAPPFGLDQLDKKDIRIIATGNDAAAFKGQTVRLLITNVQTLQSKKAVLDRYMKAYRETVDFMYRDPAALKIYAEFLGISEEKAKRSRDDFFPPESIDPDKVVGLDTILKDAVALKYTPQELTKEHLAELIQIPAR